MFVAKTPPAKEELPVYKVKSQAVSI